MVQHSLFHLRTPHHISFPASHRGPTAAHYQYSLTESFYERGDRFLKLRTQRFLVRPIRFLPRPESRRWTSTNALLCSGTERLLPLFPLYRPRGHAPRLRRLFRLRASHWPMRNSHCTVWLRQTDSGTLAQAHWLMHTGSGKLAQAYRPRHLASNPNVKTVPYRISDVCWA
jgi:hypothetical protein